MKFKMFATGRNCSCLIVCVFVFLLFACVFPLFAAIGKSQELSTEEREWLKDNADNLILAYNRNNPPVEFENSKGEFDGLGADITQIVEQYLGVTFKKVAYNNHFELMQSGATGKSLVAPVVSVRSEERQGVLFSSPYLTVPIVVVTTKNKGEISGIKDLTGAKVAVQKGALAEDYLRRYYGSTITIVPVDSICKGLRDASLGVVDAYVGGLATIAFCIEDEKIPNLMVSAMLDFEYLIAFGVSDKNPLLFSAIEKSLSKISDKEISAVKNKWLGLSENFLSKKTIKILILIIALVIAAIVLMGLFNFYLKKKLKQQKNALSSVENSLREQKIKIENSEKFFRAIVDTSIEGIAVVQKKYLVFINPKVEEIIGRNKQEILLSPFVNFIHPEDREMVQEYHDKRLSKIETDNTYDFRILRPDGQIVWIMMSATEFDWEGVPAALCMMADITPRKEALLQLQQSEEKFSRLFIMSPDPVFLVCLKDQKISDANLAFTEMFGFSKNSCIGKSTEELGIYVDSERRRLFYDQLSQGKLMSHFEIDGVKNNGDVINLSASCEKLFLGSDPYIIVTLRDMTNSLRMQKMMIETEKMLSIGGIAAGIAHEINNPLGIILQSAQNMERRVKPDFEKNIEVATRLGFSMDLLDKYFKERKLDIYLEDIKSAANRAAVIIRHMLDFSRKSESKGEFHDLKEIVNKAIDLSSKDFDLKKNYDFNQISIVREFDQDLPRVNCVATEIEQVVLNLLRNAAQAMGAVSTINPTIRVRLKSLSDEVEITIEDNGPGIPSDVRGRIFEPFFTTKKPGVGTGLGLSVSYFIVTKGHGGKMSFESSMLGGACFVITLPVIQSQAA